MSHQDFKNQLLELLKADERLWQDGEFNQTRLFDFVDKHDAILLGLLLGNEALKAKFFVKVNDIFVFKGQEFKFFLDENKLDNSYTQFENIIGLKVGSKMLKDRDEVVLNFPFKDCVLQGGQSKDEGLDIGYEYDEENGDYSEVEAKRKEVFFNEILAKDEIDRLEAKKVLKNWKRYTKDGEVAVGELKRDSDGTIQENLIIKGNNLLALHSIKNEFAGKVKLIYIDPPYNTGSDSFKYNDNFNHSTWLTFMKNRLEVAKELLRDDGVIYIQCDYNELGYLNVLMDGIFGIENKVQIISIKTASPAGFKTVNPGPIDVTEYILYYAKNKNSVIFKKGYVPVEYDSNYNLFIENIDDTAEKWKLVPIVEKFYELNGISDNKAAKEKWGKNWKQIRDIFIGDFALENANVIASKRDPHKPTDKVKQLLLQSKDIDNILEVKRDEGQSLYLYKGGSLSFYSNKLQTIDGVLTPTELLTDFWGDISWAGIANEGGIVLKNGKKPEKLLKRILELSTNKNDIILDYHLGSGTTAAVAHKMGCQYIGIEQMGYVETVAAERIKKVIEGEQGGVSKAVNWQGGGEFVYFELAEWNEEAKKHIQKAESIEDLEKFFEVMYEGYFLNYNVRVKDFKEKVLTDTKFRSLPLERQKEMFMRMLDLNQMYVNFTERNDKKFGISSADIGLSEEFYKK